MKILKGILLSVLVFGIVGCSDRESSASVDSAGVEVEKPSGVIPDAQLKALDRAKEVEALMKKTEQDLRAKIDAES